MLANDNHHLVAGSLSSSYHTDVCLRAKFEKKFGFNVLCNFVILFHDHH